MPPRKEPFAPPLKTMQSQGEPVVSANPTPGAGIALPNSGTLPIRIMPDLSGTYLTPAGGDALFLTPAEGTASYSSLSHTHTVVQSVTTTGSLNSATSSIALLRAGSSPYTFAFLVWDATYGKWVSQTWTSCSAAAATTSSTTYAQAATGTVIRPPVEGFKDLYDAGLRPQARIAGFVSIASAINTGSFRPALYSYSDGDTADTQAATGPEITITGTTTLTWKVTGWADMTIVSSTKTGAFLTAEHKTSSVSFSATLRDAQILLRWVV